MEVISNVIPVRIRIMKICNQEWIRIMLMEDGHPLKMTLLSDKPFYEGVKGSPLRYMKHIMKDLQKTLYDNK